MLRPDDLWALFETYERSAQRLESRQHTDIAGEREQLRAFLADESPDITQPDWWTGMVGRHRAAGKTFRRVRVMEEPASAYNRFMVYYGQSNVRAGEDIRYLPRSAANALALPDHDFWVFDGIRMTELRLVADGRLLGHDLIADPAMAARHEQWIERAAAVAVPSADYVAQDPTRAWPPIRLGATKGT